MHHDLDAGLIHLSKDELRILGEVRTPIDERVIGYLITGTEITISHLETAIAMQERVHSSGIETQPPHEEVVASLKNSIQKRLDLRPILEQIALDVEFKWRDSRLERSQLSSE